MKIKTLSMMIISLLIIFNTTTAKDLTIHENAIGFKGAGFVSVGNGATCTFNTGTHKIQDAIDSGALNIRVVNDQLYIEDISFTEKNIFINGRFSTCDDANSFTRSDVKSQIQATAGSAAAVIHIMSSVAVTENVQIVLDGLDLSQASGGFISGGGIYVDDDVTGYLGVSNSNIHENFSFTGGGIRINSDITLALSSTTISNNNAQYGGGIYCSHPDANITSYSTSIINNLAFKTNGIENGKGGGLYLTNGCSFSGSGAYLSSGISFNQAQAQGGGIYATGGATISLGPVIVSVGPNMTRYPYALIGNESDSDNDGNESGGAAYLDGAGTSLDIVEAKIQTNKAGGHGGAVALFNGSSLTVSPSSSNKCWNINSCNLITGNQSGANFFGAGGVIYNNNSSVEISHADISYNRADFGTVVYGSGATSLTTIKNSKIHHNGDNGGSVGAVGFNDNHVFKILSDASIDILSSTITDNSATLAVFDINHPTSASVSHIFSTIIHDPSTGDVFDVGSNNYLTDCNLVHETDSFISSGTSSVGNPMFVNRGAQDYHILPVSPAVDGCDNFNLASDGLDIDFEVRGFDDPTHANTLGPFDIGADETYTSDIIFSNSFE